jgi:hypothetical protein
MNPTCSFRFIKDAMQRQLYDLSESSNGIAPIMSKIDLLLGISDNKINESKIKNIVSNLVKYFKAQNLLTQDIASQSIATCCLEIKKKLLAKEITTPADFILAILIALLSTQPKNETQDICQTTKATEVDDKIKTIVANFRATNQTPHLTLNKQSKVKSDRAQKLNEEKIAFKKNIPKIKPTISL